jgi:hypothetical protein
VLRSPAPLQMPPCPPVCCPPRAPTSPPPSLVGPRGLSTVLRGEGGLHGSDCLRLWLKVRASRGGFRKWQRMGMLDP